MIKPTRDRVLVKMVPAVDQIHNPIKLVLIDQQKHWGHKVRWCKVLAIGPDVKVVNPGDVVVIEGSAGKTLDGEDIGYGEEYRWLDEAECLALVAPDGKTFTPEGDLKELAGVAA